MDMIMIYKIVHDLDGIHFEDIFTYSDTITTYVDAMATSYASITVI